MPSKLDKAIISAISGDIPLVREPFKDIAGKLGIEDRVLLGRIRSFKRRGLMRKFAAILNHRKAGFRYNAMVVWDIPDVIIDRAGRVMASFKEVSHCYQRKRSPRWDYNLYSMIHGRAKKECFEVVRKMRKALGGCIKHKILFSSKEEKKSGAKF